MEKEVKNYGSIGQFRNVVREFKEHFDYIGRDNEGNARYYHSKPYPTLKFRATVKTHGTNSSIVKYSDDSYVFQSKERKLSFIEDNANFMNTMALRKYKQLFDNIEFNEYCAIYGEWVGKGVTKKVAVSELENKHWIIFAIKVDGVYLNIEDYKHLSNHDDYIYNILDFDHWYFDIDFENPNEIINKIIEKKNDVETECPIGKKLGVVGIGEGIVLECFEQSFRYVFKVKGEKHAGKSKITKLNKVDDEIENKKNYVASVVTPIWRLNQMLESTFDLNNGGFLDRAKLGDYIRSVINDVVKEDIDIITDNGLELKDIGKIISNIARLYFFEQENNSEY